LGPMRQHGCHFNIVARHSTVARKPNSSNIDVRSFG
jgi:hypothetical protein